MFALDGIEIGNNELLARLEAVLPECESNVIVLDKNSFFGDGANKKRKKMSKFKQACTGILQICGDPVEREAFRGAFWRAVLRDKAIDSVILETIAFGPTSPEDLEFIKYLRIEFLVEMAKAALTVIK